MFFFLRDWDGYIDRQCSHTASPHPLLFQNNFLIIILHHFTWINIALAIFNMLPVAPLDGSQIFGNMLSKNNPELAWKLQIYGPKVLMILLVISFVVPQLSIFRFIMTPFINLFMYLFAGL